MSETQMWKNLREKLAWVADRHEDKLQKGVADVSYSVTRSDGRRVHGWLELKQIDRWPSKPGTTVVIAHFTVEQRLWLKRKGRAAGHTWLLLNVGDAKGEWLLFPWEVLDMVGRSNQADLRSVAVLDTRGLRPKDIVYFLGDR